MGRLAASLGLYLQLAASSLRTIPDHLVDGVGLSSSVIPYVFDQLAMVRLPRSTYAPSVALLPATAAIIGVVVLQEVPLPIELLGVDLVIAGVLTHRVPEPSLAK